MQLVQLDDWRQFYQEGTIRRYYYELLNNLRLTGDWEAWLDFFAEAVRNRLFRYS